jgi:uncharacterized protein YcbX
LNARSNLQLVALYIHPIKSCAGIAVAEARVTAEGLEHDRRWMIVDETGLMVSQRKYPEMALLHTRIEDGAIVVTRRDLPPLTLPFFYDDGPRIEIEVWRHRGPAVWHEAGSRWFATALGRDVRLVCLPPSIIRPITPEYNTHGETVSFADDFPYLVTSASSLADLNTRSNFPVDARRFRPNLVIAGAAPWAEDEWRVLRVGGLRFRLVKPCARCAIPSVDPDSGRTSKEPLRTLATFRQRDNKVYFGINAVADELGELRVGDVVTVEEMAPARI